MFFKESVHFIYSVQFVVFSHGCRNPVLSVYGGLLIPDAGSWISSFFL